MAPPAFEPLTLTPVSFSLTAGTDIPAPLETPPESPRPPTPGRGPLSSHPTTPILKQFSNSDLNSKLTSDGEANGRAPAMSPLSLNSPAEPFTKQPQSSLTTNISSNHTGKRPSSVRKFLSLRSLHPRASHPDSASAHRPSTPQSAASHTPSSPGLSRKRSSAWFGGPGKRKSGMFLTGRPSESREGADAEGLNGHAASGTDAVEEEQKGPPPPTIPEWESLSEGLDGGDLGAEDMFKDIK
ncbi:hypothetical protein P152DRAFT_471768 [Eremomyces bilateralis CBS 781.70]|uniref:Uncharacterized protein n=1 Tax=Eremomyces bilateralis CBS 781.70 TaxID=1392243 RepID=A0A6G1GBB3_9PEZI|nr:uncharacterized protein P152DRAFT_471768 [Eremomyces bilateralis CBS 781.70]KAF1815139.1 hypothetical protein P152DRAFT_471768 [Eremomyces bilateralis CBS 781.70]